MVLSWSAVPCVLTSPPFFSLSKPNKFTPKLSVTVKSPNRYYDSSRNALLSSAASLNSNSNSRVLEKLNGLAWEFSSLSEPIDRVKRLLHYASLLPPFQKSERVPANRVAGCGTQVWVVAERDEGGRMRFRADSDSEISKGLCWCLVWTLDGAEAEEVLMLQRDHLPSTVNVNVVNAHSRINTWHNLLLRMQKATQDLLSLPSQI